jgi:hypothetical protein
MDQVGEFALQVSLVGHQAKWSGGEHLPTRQISEAGVPAFTLSLYSGNGCPWTHVR